MEQIDNKKLYRIVNADKLADASRKWFQDLKEREGDYKQYLSKKQQYYQKNKDKIKANYKQKVYLKMISKWL